MDRERFEAGLSKRKEVLGADYVEQALANADAFSKPFQELLTEYCWGTCWGDETLTKKQRSILNLGMLAANNRMDEFGLHFKGALKNGVSREELQAVCIQIAVYCGVPTGVVIFKIAKDILAEIDAGDRINEN